MPARRDEEALRRTAGAGHRLHSPSDVYRVPDKSPWSAQTQPNPIIDKILELRRQQEAGLLDKPLAADDAAAVVAGLPGLDGYDPTSIFLGGPPGFRTPNQVEYGRENMRWWTLGLRQTRRAQMHDHIVRRAANVGNVDEVVFGHDMDGSSVTKPLDELAAFDGAAGRVARYEPTPIDFEYIAELSAGAGGGPAPTKRRDHVKMMVEAREAAEEGRQLRGSLRWDPNAISTHPSVLPGGAPTPPAELKDHPAFDGAAGVRGQFGGSVDFERTRFERPVVPKAAPHVPSAEHAGVRSPPREVDGSSPTRARLMPANFLPTRPGAVSWDAQEISEAISELEQERGLAEGELSRLSSTPPSTSASAVFPSASGLSGRSASGVHARLGHRPPPKLPRTPSVRDDAHTSSSLWDMAWAPQALGARPKAPPNVDSPGDLDHVSSSSSGRSRPRSGSPLPFGSSPVRRHAAYPADAPAAVRAAAVLAIARAVSPSSHEDASRARDRAEAPPRSAPAALGRGSGGLPASLHRRASATDEMRMGVGEWATVDVAHLVPQYPAPPQPRSVRGSRKARLAPLPPHPAEGAVEVRSELQAFEARLRAQQRRPPRTAGAADFPAPRASGRMRERLIAAFDEA